MDLMEELSGYTSQAQLKTLHIAGKYNGTTIEENDIGDQDSLPPIEDGPPKKEHRGGQLFTSWRHKIGINKDQLRQRDQQCFAVACVFFISSSPPPSAAADSTAPS